MSEAINVCYRSLVYSQPTYMIALPMQSQLSSAVSSLTSFTNAADFVLSALSTGTLIWCCRNEKRLRSASSCCLIPTSTPAPTPARSQSVPRYTTTFYECAAARRKVGVWSPAARTGQMYVGPAKTRTLAFAGSHIELGVRARWRWRMALGEADR